jgi:trk/ktr system potassium uptake protein
VRIVVAGGGSVGTAIAVDLTARQHAVTLLEIRGETAERIKKELPELDVVTCDACEVAALQQVGLRQADVVIAATGDDEDNLVISWLSKQEFAVPRVIARVNNSRNEWLFDESWGVDVHVSTPALITSLVDEAVEVGSIVSLMDLAHGKMKLAEVTLAEDAPVVTSGLTLDELRLPDSVRVVAVLRAHQPLSPQPTMRFLEDDHVVVIARADSLDALKGTFVKVQ